MLLTTPPHPVKKKTNGGVPEVGEDKAAGGGTTTGGPNVKCHLHRFTSSGGETKKKTIGDIPQLINLRAIW